ncbi:hypothetical protein C1645_811443 [Glomus cerebriforme]|uniref:Uncharacterized protein n=1 Tax=Glomus cerebriforme TaxID=658196 RepID=A0A397TR70_9GLOM|nr:hypothetical protein C1645_811443 [Glomus cerebriforme]
MRTQILTKNTNPENNIGEHILIDGISQIFPDTKIHAILSNNKSVLKDTMTRVSHHVEKFRSCFVNHEGTKEINVEVNDILVHTNSRLEGDWPEVVNRLILKSDQAVEKIAINSLLECNFSTTSKTSLTASHIVLVKAYFSYSFLCGIPKVTLEGTLEDWTKLQKKVIQLRQLDLDMNFWLDKLEPVVRKLVKTYKGEFDEEFWAKIFHCVMFQLIDNSIKLCEIPDGRVAVPFTTDTGLHLKFVAGFFGAQQKTLDNSNEMVVSSIIGWSVMDNKTMKKVLTTKSKRN